MVKNPPANAGDLKDAGLIPGLGRSLGVGNGNPLQYSCLENSTDRESDTTEQLTLYYLHCTGEDRQVKSGQPVKACSAKNC